MSVLWWHLLTFCLAADNFGDKTWWNANIGKPAKSKASATRQRAFLRLQTLLQPILLRRTKGTCQCSGFAAVFGLTPSLRRPEAGR